MPDSADTWRCFAAIAVSPPLRASLAAAVARWRTDPAVADLRWTDPAAWHLTLAFLGSTDPGRVPHLAAALQDAVRPLGPFRLMADRVGAFPRPGAVQAVWCGFHDPERCLAGLARVVQGALLAADAVTPFRAHLTLARSRIRGGQPLGPWLTTVEPPGGELAVEAVTLYRSHLGRGPARYETLARVPLGGAGSSGG